MIVRLRIHSEQELLGTDRSPRKLILVTEDIYGDITVKPLELADVGLADLQRDLERAATHPDER